jgi:hypothetical protein
VILHQGCLLLLWDWSFVKLFVILYVFHILTTVLVVGKTLINVEWGSCLQSCSLLILDFRVCIVFSCHGLLIGFHVLIVLSCCFGTWFIRALLSSMALAIGKLVCRPLVLNKALHVADKLDLILPLSESGCQFSWFITKNRCYATLENHLIIYVSGTIVALSFLTGIIDLIYSSSFVGLL